jgi:hypothetical protein
MSNDQNTTVLELSKALIGCLGVIAAACITGVFAVVAVVKPPLPGLSAPETRELPSSQPVVVVYTPTPPNKGNAMITNVVLAQGVKSGTFDPIGIATTFPADQRILHAVASVLAAPKGTMIKAVWSTVDVGNIAPSNTWIQEAEFRFDDVPNRNVDFALTPTGDRWPPGRYAGPAWPPGKYKVEIFLNGRLERTLDFMVAGE